MEEENIIDKVKNTKTLAQARVLGIPGELYDICDSVHASCDSSCPVYELNGNKVPSSKEEGCICFKNGSAMFTFIKDALKNGPPKEPEVVILPATKKEANSIVIDRTLTSQLVDLYHEKHGLIAKDLNDLQFEDARCQIIEKGFTGYYIKWQKDPKNRNLIISKEGDLSEFPRGMFDQINSYMARLFKARKLNALDKSIDNNIKKVDKFISNE